MNDERCPQCASAYAPGGTACPNCGRIRPSLERPVTEEAAAEAPRAQRLPWWAGVLLAIPVGASLFIGWGFFGFLALSAVESTFHVPACSAATGFVVLAVVVALAAIAFAVRLAGRGQIGLSLGVMLSVVVGLLPATMCTYGIGACSAP